MMNPTSIWFIIFGGMLVTYATRLSFLFIPQDWLPPTFERALRFVPPAVLSAIIMPDVLLPAGQLDLSLGNTRLLAGILAALAAWRFRNTWVTIGIGLGTLWFISTL